MSLCDVADWLDDYDRPRRLVSEAACRKHTLANPIPSGRALCAKRFHAWNLSSLNTTAIKNPDVWFDLYIVSHSDHGKVRPRCPAPVVVSLSTRPMKMTIFVA